ncbi:MAG: biotin/lipoyl-containing protein [Anaerovoracaceae bacterium]|nr:biotin/lipoyl-containing protein [Anaerovoracaceae bacterium]
MNTQEYFELLARFEASSLKVLEIEESGCRVRMEKGGLPAEVPAVSEPAFHTESAADAKPSDGTHPVKAPLVGVYYAAPSPDAAPFVQIGDRVERGQTLCILEAMKMMNELKAPVSGIIRSAGGQNGEMVQYDQVLFEVEPC